MARMTTDVGSNEGSTGPERPYDLIVFGATGYVGRLLAHYVAAHTPAGLRVALAGRTAAKVGRIVDECREFGVEFGVVEAEAGDLKSLRAMANSCSVVVSTVGPYTQQGLLLVRACVEAGTDYADLAGEPLFVRESIDAFHKEATDTGARIVHSAGFDSVPSDLLVRLLADRAAEEGTGLLTDTTLVVSKVRGGMSTGTMASGLAHVQTMAADPAKRALAADMHTHSHRRSEEPDLGPETDGALLRLRSLDPTLRGWAGGFFMGFHNTRVVRRSNTLRDWGYGTKFRYREVMAFPVPAPVSLVPAAISAAVMRSMTKSALAMKLVPGSLVDRLKPKAGLGPSQRAREKGHFTFDTYTVTDQGARYRAQFAMRGDPGYAATAVILGELAIALSLTHGATTGPTAGGGVLTPATALGPELVERFRQAGIAISTERLA